MKLTKKDIDVAEAVVAPVAEAVVVEKQVVQLDINNPKHANLTYDELQALED